MSNEKKFGLMLMQQLHAATSEAVVGENNDVEERTMPECVCGRVWRLFVFAARRAVRASLTRNEGRGEFLNVK
jgi:hypothetical protein